MPRVLTAARTAAALAIAGWSCAAAFSAALAAPPEVKHLFPSGCQRGASVEVTAAGNFPTWPAKAWVDRPGVALAAGEQPGAFTLSASDDCEPGLCWLRLYDAQGATAPLPLVIGTLPEVVEQEPNDDARAAQLTGPAVVVNGRLASGRDTDLFAVSLAKDQVLVASMEANRNLGSPVDSVLQVVGPQGTVLAQNDDQHGLDPQIAFAAPRDGTYLVRVFGFPASPGTTIAFAASDDFVYRLTITTGPFVEYTMPLSLQSGITTAVQVHGWNIPDELRLLNVSAQPAATVFLGDARLAGAVRLGVEPYPNIVESEPNDRIGPQAISLPALITGRLDPDRDRDVFQFAARQSEVVLAEVESRGLGYPVDPVLELSDSAGSSLSRVDDMGEIRDAAIQATAPAHGEYRIAVSDLYGDGGWNYVYRLRVRIAAPEFNLSVENHSFSCPAGGSVEIPITVNRQYGFTDEIAVSVQGLPPEVQATQAVSQAAGDSAGSVKLSITATAAFAGPVRIFGESAGAQGSMVHSATAPLADRNVRTTDMWITCLP